MRPVSRPEVLRTDPATSMSLPLAAVCAGLLVWGVQNDALVVALGLAVILAASHWVKWRWDLSDKDFNRLADLTGVGLVLLAIAQFEAEAARGIYGVLRWLPVALFPLLAGQYFSTRERIGYAALFISVRRAVARGTLVESGTIDFRKPYFVVCLVSAGGAEVHRELYLPAITVLVLAVLWPNRPRGHRVLISATTAAATVWLAFAASAGVADLRRAIEPILMDYFRERLYSRRDPYRAYTAMGYIGRLKQSERIVLRLTPSPGQPVPRLLREAVYQTLAGTAWIGGGSDFQALVPSADGTAWSLDQPSDAFKRITVTRHMPRGKGLIPVPLGAFRLDELPVEDLWRNRLGTLKVLRGPDLVEYHVRYRDDGSGATAPKQADLTVPRDLEATIRDVAAEIGVAGRSEREIAQAIARYFQDGFAYSLTLDRDDRAARPLVDFLLNRRRGHCEYFASATVLLLRAAGIPARYATGYAVNEWSELEQRFVVRRRHAHSWAMAFIDGEWMDIDTTPAGWLALEAQTTGWWRGGYDFMSWMRYRYDRWRWLGTEDSSTQVLLWLGLPLALYLAWRLSTSKRVRSTDSDPSGGRASQVERPASHTAFVTGMERLASRAEPPRRGESLRSWLSRLSRQGQVSPKLLPADELVELHYRCRFGPPAPTGRRPEDDLTRLEAGARQWLARLDCGPEQRSEQPGPVS